jgi:methylenetetrahydrofolate reductase (NADPH)
VGIDWCIAQSQELIAAKVPFLHYYSMGKSDNIHKVARAVF